MAISNLFKKIINKFKKKQQDPFVRTIPDVDKLIDEQVQSSSINLWVAWDAKTNKNSYNKSLQYRKESSQKKNWSKWKKRKK